MSTGQSFLLFMLVLGGAATMLRLVAGSTPRVPYPVLLALGGIVLGLVPGVRLPPIGPDLILLAFVPALVFEASLALDLDELRRRVLPIGLLATVGVVLTVALIGGMAHFGLGFDWASGLLLGAIVAATDPIAVVTLLRQVHAPAGLRAILEGESLFNDGTGVAVFSAVLGTILSGHPALVDGALRLLFVAGVGAAVGLAVGSAGVVLLRLVNEAELEIMVTLVVAYGSYLAADLVHASGVVSVVSAGIVVARFASRTGRLRGTQLLGFWNLLAFILNAILFLIVGVELPVTRLVPVAGLALAAYSIMFAARAVPVYLLLGATDIGGRRIPWRWRHMTFWGGMRGALSIALALSVAGYAGVDKRVSVIAYAMVVLSLLVQGGLLLPVARLLGVSGRDGAPSEA